MSRPARRRSVAAALALVALVGTGCGFGDGAPHVTTTPVTPMASLAGPPAAPPPAAASPGPLRPVERLEPSRPVALAIPAIGVRAEPMTELGVDAGGVLEVPADTRTAGWFRLSPAPGAPGPAVIAAHVDYRGVPGVFQRLDELEPGAEISVRRSDGSEAVFATYAVERHPKTAFPTERVYGDTDGAELRLITCGGVFDRGTGRYLDNVVAYARLVGVR
ncbi:MAG TPA: class F sortase [Pseudonocardia sp.]|nr:class F sortase [Pseudonocardia sp.]